MQQTQEINAAQVAHQLKIVAAKEQELVNLRLFTAEIIESQANEIEQLKQQLEAKHGNSQQVDA